MVRSGCMHRERGVRRSSRAFFPHSARFFGCALPSGLPHDGPMRRPTSPADSTDYRQRRGFRGEQQVRRWLEAAGWCIEAHRYRVGREEIDLVARRRELVAFIEVKTRRSLKIWLKGALYCPDFRSTQYSYMTE